MADIKEKLYKIKQKYGIDYVVNESHILTLKHKQNGIVDIPLKDYLNEKNTYCRGEFKRRKPEFGDPTLET